MNCPKCGKFMRREGFLLSNPDEYYWSCGCGNRYTEYSKITSPMFHRDAIALIQWNEERRQPLKIVDDRYGEMELTGYYPEVTK